MKILNSNIYEHSNILVKQDSGLYVYERPIELAIHPDSDDSCIKTNSVSEFTNKKVDFKSPDNNYIARFNMGDSIADLEEPYIDMLFCYIDNFGRLNILIINGLQIQKVSKSYDHIDIEGLFMWYNANIFMSKAGYITNLREILKYDYS